MNIARLWLVLLLSLQVACSELQQLRSTVLAPVVGESLLLGGWLADMRVLRARPAEELPAIRTAREKVFRTRPTLDHRMRLVLLLVIGDEPVRDEKRARRLLEKLNPLPANTSEQEFISLLRQFLTEQALSERKLSVLWKQVTTQNRRIEELEQQLQALTNIEQNIQQRDPLPVTDNGK